MITDHQLFVIIVYSYLWFSPFSVLKQRIKFAVDTTLSTFRRSVFLLTENLFGAGPGLGTEFAFYNLINLWC